MIIGFLGKGGSGKSTLATLFVKHLLHSGKSVLAVDADYNMDLADNLGQESEMNYISQGYTDIIDHMNTYSSVNDDKGSYFSLSPIDAITERYSVPIENNLRLMVAGPHTEEMMRGKGCSHGLTQPLKTYLPFLEVKDTEVVVVDEKAGTDGVGTGITVGFTSAVVVEATKHGIKSAQQISQMLKFYNTPCIFVLNKVRDTAIEIEAEKILGTKPVISIPFSEDIAFGDASSYKVLLSTLLTHLEKIEDTRKERKALYE
ncbi:MAG: hypothetical protein K9L31_01310 [Candidatus Pacebacteria bacterium]|nr:hypothetical protein [Candidatus Paceibacterota bacterium]